MKRFVTLVSITVVVGSIGCGRANPRISKLTREQGRSTQTTRFEYEDNGQPKEVEQDLGGAVNTFTFDFDGSKVTKLKLSRNPGAIDETELEYDDSGRLVKATTDLGNSDETVVTTIDYREGGEVDKVERKTTFASGDNVTSTSFTYKDGQIASVEVKNTFEQEGLASTSHTQTSEVSYKDGKVDELATDDDSGNEGTFSVEYKDGALSEIGFEGTVNARDEAATASYDYKDGLMESAKIESDDSDDIDFTIEYDDGNASDVDMMPGELTNTGFWDLRGASFGVLDVHTQVLRLAGASW